MEASTTAFSITAGAVEAGGSWPHPIEREAGIDNLIVVPPPPDFWTFRHL